jgi:SAM-dependent methyltransferase
MGVLYRVMRGAWRAIAPAGGTRRVFGDHSLASRLARRVKNTLEATAAHDELYDAGFYRKYQDHKIGGRQIVASLRRRYDFASAVDVGCGAGEILFELQSIGIAARGLERSQVALATCRKQGLVVRKFDLESDPPPGWTADLVISTEVAEHLPAFCADRYVSLMADMATLAVVVTAAPPGQGGTGHVNEQPYSYWIDKFERRGWRYCGDQTRALRIEWAELGVESQRARNVMIFTPGDH